MSEARNLPSAEDVSIVPDDVAVSDDERVEIQKEIDSLVASGGVEASLASEFLRPRRTGFALPLLVWLIAGATFAAGFLYISAYFRVREDSITVESRSYFTAESQLIQEILRESEAQLAAKDQEIGQIQDRLQQLDNEKQNLEQNLENEVAQREAQLRRQLADELAAERTRLVQSGQTQAQIDVQIAELEKQRQAEVADQLATFRADAQTQLEQLQTQLDSQTAELQQTLAASREERQRLADEASSREQQLRSQFNQQIQQLTDSERAAQDRVTQLQATQEQEQLLTDRILGSFTVIVKDIGDGATDEALRGLDSLQQLLLDEKTGSDTRERQRQTELALATTLRSLVQQTDVLRQNIAVRDLTTTDTETTQLEQQHAAELIKTAADTVALAEAAREAGRFTEARSLYQQALATIPSLEKVYPGILDLESTRREVTLQSALSDARSQLAAGSAADAVKTYIQSLQTIAAGDDDPLYDVASGISAALTQATNEVSAAADDVESGLRDDIATRDRQIARINQDLAAARNASATANATISSLRTQLASVQSDLATERDNTSARSTQLGDLQKQIASLDDQLAGAQTDLAAARSRATSLQTSLTASQSRVSDLESSQADLTQQLAQAQATVTDLQAQVASLSNELTTRPETPAPATELPAATQAELDDLNKTIAAREATIADLQSGLDETRTQLATGRTIADELKADLEEAQTQISGLQDRIATLQESRTNSTATATDLQSQVDTLQQRVSQLQSLESDINALKARYAQAASAAQSRIQSGDYENARSQILAPFATSQGANLFPGLVSTLSTAHQAIVTAAESTTTADARSAAFDDVVSLATQIEQNISAPREAAAVQSYLRREPDLQAVANELYAIVELSARSISALPDIEYKLLGSVSRITGNLVVVDRLVALEAQVGAKIEIRRAPTLGQEVPIASGTILEVTDQRVVVSVDEIYELDTPPATRDLVYLAQQ